MSPPISLVNGSTESTGLVNGSTESTGLVNGSTESTGLVNGSTDSIGLNAQAESGTTEVPHIQVAAA